VGEDDPAVLAEHAAAGVDAGEAGVAVRVDRLPVGGGQGEQVRAVRRWDRADEVQAARVEEGEVGFAVLPRVEDHRHLAAADGRARQGPVAGSELGEHGRELGHVRLVARVGVR
jgi:hypothetical protein